MGNLDGYRLSCLEWLLQIGRCADVARIRTFLAGNKQPLERRARQFVVTTNWPRHKFHTHDLRACMSSAPLRSRSKTETTRFLLLAFP
jgi:hypothetical protein